MVSIDGGAGQNVKFGDVLEAQLEAGEHTLSATNRLVTRRVSFSLSKDETVSFEVSNVVGGCLAALAVVGMAGYTVEVRRLEAAPE
jgi:hypothetical protein